MNDFLNVPVDIDVLDSGDAPRHGTDDDPARKVAERKVSYARTGPLGQARAA